MCICLDIGLQSSPWEGGLQLCILITIATVSIGGLAMRGGVSLCLRSSVKLETGVQGHMTGYPDDGDVMAVTAFIMWMGIISLNAGSRDRASCCRRRLGCYSYPWTLAGSNSLDLVVAWVQSPDSDDTRTGVPLDIIAATFSIDVILWCHIHLYPSTRVVVLFMWVPDFQ